MESTFIRDLSGEEITTESTGEYTLPDYQPEVRRLLRIDARLVPSGKFLGGSKAEFAGSVVYNLIYTDGEGQLCSTELTSEYEFAVPLTGDAEEDAVSAVPRIETVNCRLSGPRRLSLRALLRARIHVFAEESAEGEEIAVGEDCRTLHFLDRSMAVRYYTAEGIGVGDTLPLDGMTPEQVRVISCEAQPLVRECRISPEGIVCRGELWVRVLCVGAGAPLSISKKLPFEGTVPTDESAEADALCTAYACCTSVGCTPEAGSDGGTVLALDIALTLFAETAQNRPIELLRDLYSTQHLTACSYKQLALTSLVGMTGGNFSVGGSVSRAEANADGVTAVLDCRAICDMEDTSFARGIVTVNGSCRVELLVSSAPAGEGTVEYSTVSFRTPFRSEVDMRAANAESGRVECRCAWLGGVGRIEGDRLSFDGEIAVWARVTDTHTVTVLDRCAVDEEPLVREGATVIVCYPEGESLWEIGRRYHVTPEHIAEMNHLPQSVLNEPDAPSALDGLTHLLI